MKKSELKQLIKVIVQEAVVARQQKLEESKGLSGFKKTSDSVEHTEKIATEKNLTANSEPREKEEGKKLPVVKKPATPSVMKEDVVAMIREELEKHRTDEMSRTSASIRDGVAYGIGNKFKVEDKNSPTGWSIKGHPNPELYPDGMPTEAPKGPYVPKGIAGMGRPPKGSGDQSTDAVQLDVSAVMPNGKTIELDYDFINNTWPSAKKYIEQEVMSELPDALDSNVKIGQSVYDKIEAAKELEIDGKLNQSNNKITLSFDKVSKQLIAK